MYTFLFGRRVHPTLKIKDRFKMIQFLYVFVIYVILDISFTYLKKRLMK